MIAGKDGFVYIYYVNTAAFSFELFENKFTVPISGLDYYGTNEAILTDFFHRHGMIKIATRDYYEGTPYADYEADINKVCEAINKKSRGMAVDTICPSFWGNMKGILFKKFE